MMVDLKPCPFCGEHPVADDKSIWCPNRDCWGPIVENYDNLSDAVAAWNRRALSPAGAEVRELVSVKPLEWRQATTYSYADTPLGEYTVQHYTESDGSGWHAVLNDSCEIGHFPTDLIACTACQADYESRILSALSPAGVGFQANGGFRDA